MSLDRLSLDGTRFVDESGRQVILRGVNLGGDCKVPYPDGGTNFPSDFSDHREVSFIGRPFPIDEADEHLGRLKHWGFNVLRLLTTWEAVEHAGPGRYDTDYLDYFAEVCRRAADHGLYVFVDFHQDVWSRMTGGDGAPGWTLEAVGLDFTKFHAAGAAHVMQAKYDYARGGRQDAYPQMSWSSNGRLPANGVMWTLFFAGRLFTPDFQIDGRNVQDFLQGSYLGALGQVARRLKDLPNVLGFDTLNEPNPGWVGLPLSYRHKGPSEINPATARPGPATAPLDALSAARGIPTPVPLLVREPVTGRPVEAGETVLNPDGVSIWLEGRECPFERAGVYRVEGGRVVGVDEDVFRVRGERRISISEDGYGPLFHGVAETMRAVNPDWLLFAEIDPLGAAARRRFPSQMPERSVNASHWYDTTTLHLKTFDPQRSPDFLTGEIATSPGQIRERFVRQLAARAAPAAEFPGGGAPTLIGEFGIPYDLDEGAAYAAWAEGRRDAAVWSKHEAALTLMYDAMDELLLSSTQWNYTASNRNDLAVGDGWNQEDLSIFSRDQQDDPSDRDSGGRAVGGFCRPYVQRAQGRLLSMRFRAEARLVVEIDADPAIGHPTVIYAPRLRFPGGPQVTVGGVGGRLAYDAPAQVLEVHARSRGLLTIELVSKD
ncbi:cellulase family glycosylhydrolase [Phenylobacterium terrae]|uniref:Cellulase family glycosylhydrolase n=1 Tax=Phenylobacterium terrae TaxID=2665495 RepID=A0ABW4N6N4_9CAUL